MSKRRSEAATAWRRIFVGVAAALMLSGGICLDGDSDGPRCQSAEDCRARGFPEADVICFEGLCCRFGPCDCTDTQSCVEGDFGCPACFERPTGPTCPGECARDEDCGPGEHCIPGYWWYPARRLCNSCVPAATDPSCATMCNGVQGPCGSSNTLCVHFAEVDCDRCAQVATGPTCGNECLSDADCVEPGYGDWCVKTDPERCNDCRRSGE